MTLDRALIAFMLVVGAGIGVVLTIRPDLQNLPVPPYFWVLIAMALFEGVNFSRGGVMPSMQGRLFGFVGGVILMIAVPVAAAAIAGRT